MSDTDRQLAATRTSDGHHLSRQQIAGHGKDRYPTVELNALKLWSESGELADAILRALDAHLVGPAERQELLDHVRHEYADTGLALHALGDKLGLDLIECMRELVEADERKFT